MLPWAWCARETVRLLEAYPAGVTEAVLTSELQRRWNENNHLWGRNLGGRAAAVHLILAEQRVPLSAVLEVRLRAVDGGEAEVEDLRGGRMRWRLPARLMSVAGVELVRLAVLRVGRGRQGPPRLLPTDCVAVVESSLETIRTRAETMRIAGGVRMVAGKVQEVLDNGAGEQDLTELVNVVLDTDMNVCLPRGLAGLMRVGDELVVGPLTEDGSYGSATVAYIHPVDPLADSDGGGKALVDWSRRMERASVSQLVQSPSAGQGATLLVCVRRVRTHNDEETAVRLASETGSSEWLYCGGRLAQQAATLMPGQWILLQGVRSGPGPRKKALMLFLEPPMGSLRLMPLPGLLSSPALWPSSSAPLSSSFSGPLQGCLLVLESHNETDGCCVLIDDGHCSIRAQCAVEARAQLEAAAGPLNVGQMLGARWNVWLVNNDGNMRMDACVPAHCMQLVNRLLNELAAD